MEYTIYYSHILFVLVALAMNMLICRTTVVALDERGENERRLVYDLFEKNGYNAMIRPVHHANESLPIEFNLALSQIINVDEVKQVMKTNVWLQLYWKDFQLEWNPLDYGGIDSIRIKPGMVWVPDFVLFNNNDGNFEMTYKSNTVLYSQAQVNWIPPAIYQSFCNIDVRYFPFDQQVCEMKFGSLTHKGKALTYSFYQNMDKLILKDYLISGSWDIIDGPARIDTITDKDTGEEKQYIFYKFVLRRKTLYYTVNLIIPCVIISFVSICVFALPADAGEKVTLCISVLLALIVFLLLVSKILPPAESLPLIAKFLIFIFMMNMISILSTVIIINRNYRTPRTHQMPDWVRAIFLEKLPKYLLMERPASEERKEGKTLSSSSLPSFHSTPETRRVNMARSNDLLELTEVNHTLWKSKNIGGFHKDSWSQHSNTGSPWNANSATFPRSTPIQRDSPDSANQFQMTPELNKTISAVKFIYHHLKTEEDYETILEDWKYVARVLDRLLLLIFLVVTTAGTMGILLNAPHILERVDQDAILDVLKAYYDNITKQA